MVYTWLVSFYRPNVRPTSHRLVHHRAFWNEEDRVPVSTPRLPRRRPPCWAGRPPLRPFCGVFALLVFFFLVRPLPVCAYPIYFAMLSTGLRLRSCGRSAFKWNEVHRAGSRACRNPSNPYFAWLRARGGPGARLTIARRSLLLSHLLMVALCLWAPPPHRGPRPRAHAHDHPREPGAPRCRNSSGYTCGATSGCAFVIRRLSRASPAASSDICQTEASFRTSPTGRKSILSSRLA